MNTSCLWFIWSSFLCCRGYCRGSCDLLWSLLYIIMWVVYNPSTCNVLYRCMSSYVLYMHVLRIDASRTGKCSTPWPKTDSCTIYWFYLGRTSTSSNTRTCIHYDFCKQSYVRGKREILILTWFRFGINPLVPILLLVGFSILLIILYFPIFPM